MIHIQQEGAWKTLNFFEELQSLSGYVNKVDPTQLKLDHAIGFYTEKEQVHCGLTNCNSPHNKGVVIKFVSGEITNIGHICGKNHYGVEFSDSHRSINQSYNDHVNRKTISKFKFENPTFIDDFKAITKRLKQNDLNNKCVSLIKGKYNDFHVPQPIVEHIGFMVSTRSLSLSVKKKIKKGYLDDGIVHDPVYSQVDVGRVKGLDFLFEENRRHTLVNDIEQSIMCISSITTGSDSKHLKDAANLCGSIISQVEYHIAIIDKGYDLLRKTNLEKLTEIDLNPKEKKQLSRLINEIAIE